jgi:hypothetical protein
LRIKACNWIGLRGSGYLARCHRRTHSWVSPGTDRCNVATSGSEQFKTGYKITDANQCKSTAKIPKKRWGRGEEVFAKSMQTESKRGFAAKAE